MIGSLLIYCQAYKVLRRQALIDVHLCLALGEIVEIRHKKHAQHHRWVEGWPTKCSLAPVIFDQLFGESLPIDDIVQLAIEMVRADDLVVEELSEEGMIPILIGKVSFLRRW